MKTLLAKSYCISIICIVVSLIVASPSLAKQYAYLIGYDGTVVKLDVGTDTIASTSNIKDVRDIQDVTVDDTKKLLYIAYGRYATFGVSVYNLMTLGFKKDLGITAGSYDVRIIAPPLSNKFFVDWWDDTRNDRFFTSFNATTFAKIADLSPYPIITFQIFYSKDKTKLYSIDPSAIDVYNTDNLNLLKSISLKEIFTPGIFGYGIDDYENERILVVENVKKAREEPNNYTLYTYSIESGQKSQKILTGMKGESKLSPNGDKIFFSEEEVIFGADGSVEYVKSLGHLRVYNVATGEKRGTVNFTVDKGSGIAGVHPSGNKVYMTGKITGVNSLLVMDVVNFKVVKIIKIPDTIQSMEFWTE